MNTRDQTGDIRTELWNILLGLKADEDRVDRLVPEEPDAEELMNANNRHPLLG